MKNQKSNTMKKLIFVAILMSSFLYGCIPGFEWDDTGYKVIVLNADDVAYEFKSDQVFDYYSQPEDIFYTGVLNSNTNADYLYLGGCFELTSAVEFDSVHAIPTGEYEYDFRKVDINQVLVFKLKDDSYAMVKTVEHVYVGGDDNEHVVTLHVVYPAFTDEQESENQNPDVEISNETWEFLTDITGYVVTGLSSYDGYSNDLWVSGYRSSTMYAGSILSIRGHSDYIDKNYTPDQVDVRDVHCFGQYEHYMCTSGGQFTTWGVEEYGKFTPLTSYGGWANSIWFTSKTNGFVVTNTDVFQTNDGGLSWEKYDEFESGQGFGDVEFVNETTGYILVDWAGSTGVIYKTIDGGANWNKILFSISYLDPPNANSINSMHFLNEKVGYICGEYGEIYGTTDGGDTWSIKRKGDISAESLNDIQVVSVLEAWACGNNGTLLHTIDAGETWVQVDVGESNNFVAIEFNGPFSGWVATSNKLYHYFNESKAYNYFIAKN